MSIFEVKALIEDKIWQLFEKLPDFDPTWSDKRKTQWLDFFFRVTRMTKVVGIYDSQSVDEIKDEEEKKS